MRVAAETELPERVYAKNSTAPILAHMAHVYLN